MLYLLDPGARGSFAVGRFAKAAEAEGFLVAGSNNSRNGPMEPIKQAIEAMWTDTHMRFAIDDKRVYAGGHSGGSRVSLLWALAGSLKGVIACGAGFGTSELPKQIPFRLFLIAGTEDFNHAEIYAQSLALQKRRMEHYWAEFRGGHEWLPEPMTVEALQYLSGKLTAKGAPDSKEGRRDTDRFFREAEAFTAAEARDKRTLAVDLRKRADKPEDSADRRIARQVIGAVSSGAMDQARQHRQRKEYAAEAGTLETILLLRPGNAAAWYSLAVASAGAGNRKRAFEAIEKAAAAGFSDWGRADAEPLLAAIRTEERYHALRK
jgi:hypothetical protein